MDLRLLTTFVTVAETGTVTAAAEKLHVTQPSLSRQLQQLERSIGVALFIRSNARLTLSPAGQSFLPAARDLLNRVDLVRREAADLAAGRLSELTIAGPATTVVDVVAPFLATFDESDPIPLVNETELPTDLHQLLLQVDMAVVPELPPVELRSLHLATLPVFAYVHPDHPWAEVGRVSLQALSTVPLLVADRSHKSRRVLDAALELAGTGPDDLVQTSTGQVAQALAAAGRGIAVVSDDPRYDLVGLRIASGNVDLQLRLYACWRRDHHAQNSLRRIAERLRDFCTRQYGAELGV